MGVQIPVIGFEKAFFFENPIPDIFKGGGVRAASVPAPMLPAMLALDKINAGSITHFKCFCVRGSP